MTSATATRARPRVRVIIPIVIAAAWALALVADWTGAATVLHHHHLIEDGPPLWASLVLFILAWQVMVAAMMLPSSLPLIRLFAVASRPQPRSGTVLAAFLAGYAAVWTGFGALAFLGDYLLHRAVDATPWLGRRPWIIAGTVVGLAGVFQFSKLKDRCLEQCRHPAQFLLRYYRRGVGAAFDIGSGHGIFCLGCCWALMLLMFAAGVAHLAWMGVLTALMVYEKVGRRGRGAGQISGVALLALALIIYAHPAWLPKSIAEI